MRPSNPRALVATLSALALGLASHACALTRKADLVDIRYFSPERTAARADPRASPSAPAALSAAGPLQVRLGRVTSGANLRERIVYRASPHELGRYRDLRWTERPETYVRRELGRSLFEAHGMHRALDRFAPTLDVEVIAFDELRLDKGRSAQIKLRVILYSEDSVLFEDTLTIQRPVAGDAPGIEGVVGAMSFALEAAADQVALMVQKSLAAKGAATATASPP
jgi:cholesterol transport system auxiliary component